MKRTNTKIGDIFLVKLDLNSYRYFQLVASDLTQLNSDVIRVFKKLYKIDENPTLSDLITGEVDFYAHCVIKWGIKSGLWEKIGNSSDCETGEVFFRISGDYGNPKVVISKDWWVWKTNEQMKHIGKLEGDYLKADIGIVISPDSILNRIKYGEYDFFYPGY
jgi:hypothetical protein